MTRTAGFDRRGARALAVTGLGQQTLIDAYGTPAVMAVDRAHLPAVPDEGENRKSVVRVGIDEVARVMIVTRAPPFCRQPAVPGGCFAQRRLHFTGHPVRIERDSRSEAIGEALQLRNLAHRGNSAPGARLITEREVRIADSTMPRAASICSRQMRSAVSPSPRASAFTSARCSRDISWERLRRPRPRCRSR